MKKGFFYFLIFILMAWQRFSFAVPTLNDMETMSYSSDPCSMEGMLELVNRPTVSDSPCVVSPGRVLLESGFQYLNLRTVTNVRGEGTGYLYPQAEIRYGFRGENEAFVILPNITSQTNPDKTGLGVMSLGMKHETLHFRKGVFSLEGVVTPPSGNMLFGSSKGGLMANGIVTYLWDREWSLLGMLGAGVQSLSYKSGGSSFFTVNPDVVLTWQPLKSVALYGEVYGQSSTGPGQGAGCNADAGIQYLFTKDIELDLEGGVRVSGELGGFNRYVGVGFGILF